MSALDPRPNAGGDLSASLEQLLDEVARRAATHAAETVQEHHEHQILSVPEAADLLDVDVDVVYRELGAGRLPGRKVGKCWRIPRRSLLEHLAGES